MSKLPVISGKELIKILIAFGFYIHHRKGSHVTLKKDYPPCRVTVPDHKTLKKGLLLGILKRAGMSKDDI